MKLRHLFSMGACLTLAAAGLVGLGGATPATAAGLGGATAACVAPEPTASRNGVRHDDEGVTPAQSAAIQKYTHQRVDAFLDAARTRSRVAPRVATTLPAHVYVPVYAHVIRGSHASDRKVTTPQVNYAVKILTKAFDGAQSSANVPTRYTFFVKAIDFTRNDTWFHATLFDKADTAEKQHLHRGNARSLNLYFVGGGRSAQGTLLGWSAFPWQQKRAPLRDSVSVNVQAIIHGNLKDYNLGDTVVHETGHWLGLLHTFQGGCTEPNDQVADTPEEAGPAEGCPPDSTDTCKSNPGTDPIHNFMDYAIDSCMFEFTAGQGARMDDEWIAYRQSAS